MLRRFILLMAYGLLLWPLAEVLQHRSDQGVLFQRYSPAYFTWVLFYLIFFAGWTIFTLLALSRWDRLVAGLQRLGRDPSKSRWLWISLPLAWTALLAFVMVVGRTASTTTPHSAAVPLALLFGLTLVVLAHLAEASTLPSRTLPGTPWLDYVSASRVGGHITAAARWLAAGRRATLASLAVLTVTAVALFAPALFRPDRLVGGNDLRYLYYILEQYTTDTMRAGRLPLWHPYLFSGYPVLNHPQTMVFYPVQLILRLLLPVGGAITWGLFVHVWLSGVSMFALCRAFKLTPWIALICALTYMLNGGLLTRIQGGHIWLVYALAWLPLAWLLLLRALGGSVPALVGAGVVLACVILTGHPTFPAYMLLFLGLYWIYHVLDLWITGHSLDALLKAGVRFAAMVAIALGLAAIQLVPVAAFAAEASLSEGYDLVGANTGALIMHNLTMVVVPDAYPQPTQAIWEQFPYLGVLVPAAALWGLAHRAQRRLAIGLGLIALLAVVLAFGHELRLFSLLYYAFPPFRVLRVPARALVMWIPAVTVLGGLGLQALVERDAREGWVAWGADLLRTAGQIVFGILCGYAAALLAGFEWPAGSGRIQLAVDLAACGAVLALVQVRAGLAAGLLPKQGWRAAAWMAPVAACALGGFLILPRAIPPAAPPAGVVAGLGKAALLLFAVALLLPAIYQSRGMPAAALLALLISFGDLFTFGTRYIPVSETRPAIDAAEQQILKVIPPPPLGRFMGGDVPGRLAGDILPHLGNELALLGITNIDGYNSGFLKGYASYLRGMSTNPPADTVVLLSNTSYPELDERALDFLSVTHIFSTRPVDKVGRELVAEVPGEYFIYRNPDALPVAFWVGDVRVTRTPDEALRTMLKPDFDYRTTVVLEQPVSLTKRSAARPQVEVIDYVPSDGAFLIQTRSEDDGVLVLSEPYYSERHARIDGHDVPLLRANLGFMAVALPAGVHEVQITYVPDSLYRGIQIALITAGVCLGLIGHDLWRRTRIASAL